VSEIRGFLGFANYYSAFFPGYAGLAAPLMDLLQVGKFEGRKGSKVPVYFQPEHHEAFRAIKERLLAGLSLHTWYRTDLLC